MKMSAVLTAMVLFLAACGGDGTPAAEGSPCPAAPAVLDETPNLPPGFPTPDGVVYTDSERAGPSSLVRGFWESEIGGAFEGYKAAFESADYVILDEEQELADAEVVFSGGGTTGQVKLIEVCEGRSTVTITIRPN